MDMDSPNLSTQLIQSLAELDETAVLDIVRRRIAERDDPFAIIEDCQNGMRQVGDRYALRQYYLSGLIFAGDILRESMEIIQPAVEKWLSGQTAGTILLGTVRGDIHDLGKDTFAMLLSCYGFSVHDLGVNVPPAEFARQHAVLQPDIVGLSGLLSASYREMHETVVLIRASKATGEPATPVIIGGNVDEQVCAYVGADHWTLDAMDGVRWCLGQVDSQVPVKIPH
jgi:methanogenic corrinoid protein MtbC1